MEEEPNYYAILPANVRYDFDLKDKAKLLYAEITSLANSQGYCWATNKYFGELYNISSETVSRLIKDLINKGYLKSEFIYKGNSREIQQRRLYLLTKSSIGIDQMVKGGIDQKVKENNKNKNNKKEYIFIMPTIEEITEYCKLRNNNVDPQEFYDYYDVASWKDSNGKQIKNWKQKVIYWEKRNKEKNNLKNKKQKQQEEYEKMWEKIFEEEKQNESNGN
jgi:SOS-response transcriptional repressor LexA